VIHVGDKVLVLGEAVEVVSGVGVLVEFFSKTDQYSGWIREDLVHHHPPEPVPEPPDGTWLVGGENPDTGEQSVFRRDDAEGRSDRPVRRHDRHWWDYAGSEWVDWPEAVRRGADPHRRLIEHLGVPAEHRGGGS
jgi:hypothetical protein